MNGPLAYTDSKPQGAADFYFAINATFRFIRRTLGEEALRAYWSYCVREAAARNASLTVRIQGGNGQCR